jgi:hypothetical protein
VKGGHYLKEILILNSFCFEDKDQRFTRLKPGLALRLLSKGLFYLRAMVSVKYLVGYYISKYIENKKYK